MFWSSSRKNLKMMSAIQEKIAKKIVKKKDLKKIAKKISFFLRKVVKTVFLACFTTRENA